MTGGVLFWVQHLLGSGHLRRTAAIALATAAQGVDVTVASGGLPLGHLDTGAARLVHLEPVRAGDTGFRTLVDRRGEPVTEALLARRRDALVGLVRQAAPAVVVTETFPFGRRALRVEALALLDAAAALPRPPAVVASVRDILQREDRPDRIAAMVETARDRYDLVLVHGDPRLIALGESFPAAALLADRLVHTGYVATAPAAAAGAEGDGCDEVIVSTGGGAVGRRLLEAAAAARPLSRRAGARIWRLLAGDGAPAAVSAAPGLLVEPNRPDFGALLGRCAVSVSQAGYNTATDLFASGARAVLVPFGGGRETEQGDRARRLAERGFAVVVEEKALTPAALAAAVDRALDGPPPPRGTVDLDGAATSARLLAERARHG